jgi:hypothetical protein
MILLSFIIPSMFITSYMILLCLFNSKIFQKKREEVNIKLIINLEWPKGLLTIIYIFFKSLFSNNAVIQSTSFDDSSSISFLDTYKPSKNLKK